HWLALQRDPGRWVCLAVDDQFGIKPEVELALLAAQDVTARAKTGDGRRAERTTQPLLEQLLPLEAAGGRVEAAGHGVNPLRFADIDVGPVLVEHIADPGPRRADDVGASQDVETTTPGQVANIDTEGTWGIADVDVPVIAAAV